MKLLDDDSRAVFWQFKEGYMYNNEVIKFLLTLLVIKCVRRDNVQKKSHI